MSLSDEERHSLEPRKFELRTGMQWQVLKVDRSTFMIAD